VNLNQNTQKVDFIFLAFQQNSLSLDDLYSRYASDELLIPLLNLSNRYPQKTRIKTVFF